MNAPLDAVVESLVLPSTLTDLAEEYFTHAVRVRGIQESRRNSERLYLYRFFDWFGPPNSPEDQTSVKTGHSRDLSRKLNAPGERLLWGS